MTMTFDALTAHYRDSRDGLPPRARNRGVALCGVVALVVAGVAALIVWLRPDVYQSTAVLSIDQPRAIAASADAGVIDKLSRLRLKYAGLVSTEAFAAPVAAHFGTSSADVSRELFAKPVGDSLLLQVGAQAPDKSSARQLAGAAAEALVEYVHHEETSNHIPGGERFSFSLVSAAEDGQHISPSGKSIAGAGALAGVVALGAGLALVSLRRVER